MTVESASRGSGSELRLKNHFCFRAHWCSRSAVSFSRQFGFGTIFISAVSCRKQRLEADGVGCSAAKAVKADKVEDENDEHEDEWKEDDTVWIQKCEYIVGLFDLDI